MGFLTPEVYNILERAKVRKENLQKSHEKDYEIMLKMTKLKCTPKAKLIALEIIKC
jgi:hypothetical protein